MTRLAVFGPGASELVDLLRALGYDATENVESKDEIDVVVIRGTEAAESITSALREVPSVLVAESIDTAAIECAARIGAIDIVLVGDDSHLRLAIEQAARHRPPSEGVAVSEDELLRHVVDLTPNYISVCDEVGRFVLVSQSLADFYGTTVEEIVGKTITGVASPIEAAAEMADHLQVLKTRHSKVSEREVTDRSGARRRLQLIKRPLALRDSSADLVLTVGIDVTRRYRTEAALENTASFMSDVLETISESVFALDLSGKFTLANTSLTALLGKERHNLLGTAFTKIFAEASLLDAKRQLAQAASGTENCIFDARLARDDGQECIVTATLQPLLRQGTQVGVVGTAIDITERCAAENRIEYLAYHDPLTNLPNRRLLNDRLEMAISNAARDHRSVGLLFLDIDRFKSINDTLGHRVGDSILQELADRLRGCIRASDTIARMGGDEFVILISSLTDQSDADRIAENVVEVVRRPFTIEGTDVLTTACIGISLYPQLALDGDALIRQADVALFECKRHGRDTFRSYNASMSLRSHQRFELEHDMRRALRNKEFLLYYQPIVDIQSNAVVSVEALLRWEHPTRGLLLPDTFIELAEETGAIVRLGEWVIGEATRQNMAWRRAGLPPIRMAVNVSARQFEGQLVAAIAGALNDMQMEGDALVLELTESVLMESAASPLRIIKELKALNVRLAIDDFGTGYSSLSYLERFPIDSLKIDRSFMPRDSGESRSGVVASAVIALALSLGLSVVAEGVERAEQCEFLLARGCTLAQGHYFAKAMPPADVEALLRGDASHRILP